MKLIDWYNFNYVQNAAMNVITKYDLVVFKPTDNNTYKEEDIILKSGNVKIADAVDLFADFNLEIVSNNNITSTGRLILYLVDNVEVSGDSDQAF